MDWLLAHAEIERGRSARHNTFGDRNTNVIQADARHARQSDARQIKSRLGGACYEGSSLYVYQANGEGVTASELGQAAPVRHDGHDWRVRTESDYTGSTRRAAAYLYFPRFLSAAACVTAPDSDTVPQLIPASGLYRATSTQRGGEGGGCWRPTTGAIADLSQISAAAAGA